MHEAATPEVDLDAYFARIGYRGPRAASLATLRRLHVLHEAAIPFEAIDVLLGHPVDISPRAVDAKLLAGGRGGYCYEHNSLFRRVLGALGFAVDGLAARVQRTGGGDAAPLPRTHMALRVSVEGEAWLADVGFGGGGPSAPLRMDDTAPQRERFDTYRLVGRGEGILLESKSRGGWSPVYEVSLEPQLEVDYVPPNWYTSTHPASNFRKTLMVALTTPEARYTLLDNRLTIRAPDGATERRTLDAEKIEKALAKTFNLPVESAWRPIIEQAARSRLME